MPRFLLAHLVHTHFSTWTLHHTWTQFTTLALCLDLRILSSIRIEIEIAWPDWDFSYEGAAGGWPEHKISIGAYTMSARGTGFLIEEPLKPPCSSPLPSLPLVMPLLHLPHLLNISCYRSDCDIVYSNSGSTSIKIRGERGAWGERENLTGKSEKKCVNCTKSW